MVGTTLGHYKIVETLGQGGMGIVYKARDLKLDRFVALKVLPPDKTSDLSRKQRFVFEARAASALNHPNIVIIYDIADEAGVDFIVMEYVPGKTLDQVIPRTGMRPAEALHHATQIAAALSVAHEAGITHRDLKPGNIMVTERGVVKILDFGLAKLAERGPLTAGDTTVTNRPETEKGTILGTVAYMSPEQAEGKAVDTRSDIFSFGSVLYEMCTGARAFTGETKLSTLSAILREDPKPVRESNEDTPPELERIINRCLRKSPAKRFQGTADLVVALEELREESDSGRLSPSTVALEAAKPAPRRWGLIAAGMIAIAAGGAWIATRKPAPPNVVQHGPVLTQLTFDPGLTTEPAYWPQGDLIAYASDRATDGQNLDIWIQQLNGGEARRLTTHGSDDRTPDIAPDGSKIVFRSERDGGGLYVVPTIGGAERKIATEGWDPKFSPDGQWIAYWVGDDGTVTDMFSPIQAGSKIFVVPASGGTPKPAFDLTGIHHPAWSPDSKRLLFAWYRGQGSSDWYTSSLDGGEPKPAKLRAATDGARLQGLNAQVRWTPQGIYFTARVGDSTNTWKSGWDPGKLEATAEVTRVTTSSGAESHITVAGDALVYASTVNNDDVYLLPMDANAAKATGEPVRITRSVAPEYGASISEDGTRIQYAALMSGELVIFHRDLASGRETRISSMSAGPASVSISPDGKRVAWNVRAGGKNEVHVGGPDVSSSKVNDNGQVRSWGGKPPRILLSRGPEQFLLDPDSHEETKILDLGNGVRAVHQSLDGRYAVYYSRRGGKSWVFLAPVSPGTVGTEKDIIAVTEGKFNDLLPEISPDNKIVYFHSNRDGFQCLWAQRMNLVEKRREGAPFAVKHFHSARLSPAHVGAGRRVIDMAKDKIVFTMAERTGNIWRAQLPK